MIIYIILVMAFITLFTIAYIILSLIFKKKYVVEERLEKIAKDDPKVREDELSKPLFVRIIRPILDDISRIVIKATPKEVSAAFEKKVSMAGKPFNLGVKDWVNIQVVSIIFFPLVTTIVGNYLSIDLRKIIFSVLIEIGFGAMLPKLILNKKIRERQKKILNSLPDILDLLTVSVEAGLSFDGALAKVIDKMPGALADEFGDVLSEIKLGKQKRDALRDMADRIGIRDLTAFVGAIIQADQFGVSIGNVLRLQSEQMRQKRRQRAQEKAMKAPVKMLIPMVLFIFPTIFSVLIGPIAIIVLNTFLKK